MGLISFIADAGIKLFGSDESQITEPTKPIRQHLQDNGIDITHLNTSFNNGTVRLEGYVPNAEQREKAVLVAGNVRGVSAVDDLLKVGAPSAESAAVTAEAPSPTDAAGAPGAIGSLINAIQSGAAAAVEGWSSATYTVKKGDTLSAIAKAMYGKASKYPVIFEANRPMLSDPDKIYPGQVLRIPPVQD